jgi:hypothetical protein
MRIHQTLVTHFFPLAATRNESFESPADRFDGENKPRRDKTKPGGPSASDFIFASDVFKKDDRIGDSQSIIRCRLHLGKKKIAGGVHRIPLAGNPRGGERRMVRY